MFERNKIPAKAKRGFQEEGFSEKEEEKKLKEQKSEKNS